MKTEQLLVLRPLDEASKYIKKLMFQETVSVCVCLAFSFIFRFYFKSGLCVPLVWDAMSIHTVFYGQGNRACIWTQSAVGSFQLFGSDQHFALQRLESALDGSTVEARVRRQTLIAGEAKAAITPSIDQTVENILF